MITFILMALVAQPSPEVDIVRAQPAVAGTTLAVAQVSAEPVAEDKASKIFSIGAEARPRMEKVFSGSLGAVPGASNFRVTQRSRLHGTVSLDKISAKMSIQDIRTWATEGSTLGDASAETLDFHEAWAQYAGEKYTLRVGRQELSIDGERLIGAVNWAQQARSFDALKLSTKWGNANEGVLFAARVPDGGLHDLYVAHFVKHFANIRLSIPLLLQSNLSVRRTERGARVNDWTRVTGGVHLKQEGNFNWRAEAYVQTGTNTFAYMAAVRVGYKISDTLHPQLWVDYLSGDPDHTDGRTQSFDTPFATNHKFYGYMDRFLNLPAQTAGGGLVDIALKQTGQVGPGTLHAAAHLFTLAQTDIQGRSGVRAFEVDLVYTMPISKGFKVQAGEGLFVDQGDFAIQGQMSVRDWFFLQMIVTI